MIFRQYLKNYLLACYQMSLRQKETSGAPKSKLTSTPLSQQRKAFIARYIQRIGTTRAQAPVGTEFSSETDVTDKKYTWFVNIGDPYCPRIHLGVKLVDGHLHYKIPEKDDLPVHGWLLQYCKNAKQYAQNVADEGYRFYEAGAGASNALDSDKSYREWSNINVQNFIANENENGKDASSLVDIENLGHEIASTKCLHDQSDWLAAIPTNNERLPTAFQMLWKGPTQKQFLELMHMIELIRLRGMYCSVKEYATNEEGTWRLYEDSEIGKQGMGGRKWRHTLKIIPLQSKTSKYSKSLTRVHLNRADHRPQLDWFCFNDSDAMDEENILPLEDPNVGAPTVNDTEDTGNNPTVMYYTDRLQRYCRKVIALCESILNTKYVEKDELLFPKEKQDEIVRQFLMRERAALVERTYHRF